MPGFPTDQRSLRTRRSEPLLGVLVEENGEEVVRYFAGDIPTDTSAKAGIADALSVIGAWSDLDWEETAEALDRIRHDSLPTPPIEL